MKKLFLKFTLFSSILILSTPSFAEWTRVDKSISGVTSYINLEKIRIHRGYVYFWLLQDYIEPTKYGILSRKVYNQVDCKLFRYKSLSSVVHKKPMGQGWWRTSRHKKREWRYPSAGSVLEIALKRICRSLISATSD